MTQYRDLISSNPIVATALYHRQRQCRRDATTATLPPPLLLQTLPSSAVEWHSFPSLCTLCTTAVSSSRSIYRPTYAHSGH